MLLLSHRFANESDKNRIRRLCLRAVGPHDYVLGILKDTISVGGLLLAFSGEELVGMVNLSQTIDRACWLGMARVDPVWRGKGVAQYLQNGASDWAKALGLRRLRLFVNSDNASSIRASEKGGFSVVAEAAHISARLEAKRSGEKVKPLRCSSAISRSILSSKYLIQMNGYLGHGWRLIKGSHGVLRSLSAEERIYRSGDSIYYVSSAEMGRRKRYVEFSILKGPFLPSLKLVLKDLRGRGADSVGTFIPFDSYLLRAAKKMGFEKDKWGSHCLLFERQV